MSLRRPLLAALLLLAVPPASASPGASAAPAAAASAPTAPAASAPAAPPVVPAPLAPKAAAAPPTGPATGRLSGSRKTVTLSAKDVADIVAVGTAIDAAWDARDAAGMAAHFSEDVDMRVLGATGERRIRGGMEADYKAFFPKVGPAIRHRTVTDELHPLTADLVAVDARAWVERLLPDGTRQTVYAYASSSLLERTPGGWKVRLARTHSVTEPLPAAPAPRAAR